MEGLISRLYYSWDSSPTPVGGSGEVVCSCQAAGDAADKRLTAQRLIRQYAQLAVANSVNPIPGLDIGIDVAILTALHHSLTTLYGLENEPALAWNLPSEPQACCLSLLKPLAQRLLPTFASRAAIALLEELGLECLGRQTAKWLPFLGTAVSATIAYQLVFRYGEKLLQQCEAVGNSAEDGQLLEAA